MTAVRVRRVAESDWGEIVAMEAEAYRDAGLSEEPAVLRSRADASPATSFVADAGGRLAGYVLALPYPYGHCPDPAREEALSEQDEAGLAARHGSDLHLHDMVVAARHRRTGVGRTLLTHLTDTALRLGYRRVSLVAVGGAEAFWTARGFRRCHDVAPPAGYGPQARYLSRLLVSPRPDSPLKREWRHAHPR